MRYPDPRLPVVQAPRSLLKNPVVLESKVGMPFYERPWSLKAVVPSEPAECGCLERCQSELMDLLQALESYQVEP
jgi:hypothetical protein